MFVYSANPFGWVLCHFHAEEIIFSKSSCLIFAYDGSGVGLAVADGLSLFGNLFGVGVSGLWNGHVRYELLRNLPWLLAMVVGCTPLLSRLFSRFSQKRPALAGLGAVLAVGIGLVINTAYLVDAGYNPFLYFRF